ncbi:MAG: hypothetical protein IJ774_00550, partial [Selenomonadaceae bacterium]|nr:hypothetical protein [Selenomonadaceae bacterium]
MKSRRRFGYRRQCRKLRRSQLEISTAFRYRRQPSRTSAVAQLEIRIRQRFDIGVNRRELRRSRNLKSEFDNVSAIGVNRRELRRSRNLK